MVSEKAKSYLKAYAVIAVLFACIIALRYVPVYRAPLGETTPMMEARALIKEGKCAQGVGLYERLGRDGDEVAYRSLGKVFWWTQCGVWNLTRAVGYIRLAAANGDCQSNSTLAMIALSFPKIDGITHMPPRNNFLAAALCSGDSDSEMYDKYYYNDLDQTVAEAFFEALAERRGILEGPASEHEAITRLISEGQGYDRNPKPRENFEKNRQ